MKTTSAVDIKVADEVWIVTALMHSEHPKRIDFTIDEVMERARKEELAGKLRPGVYAHVVQHCVANRPPNSGRYRVLFETAPGRRRLFRHGDVYDPAREGAGRIFQLNTRACWTGIKAGVKTAWRSGSRTIPCWHCMATARISGQTSPLTNTCAGFARAGNESHLLGHKSVYLSAGAE